MDVRVMEKITKDNLASIKENCAVEAAQWIKVGMSTCGIAAGAGEVFNVFKEELESKNISVEVKQTGCLGMCYCEPLVEVKIEGLPQVIYGRVDQDVARKIVEEHVTGKKLIQDHIYDLELTC